MIQGIPHVAPFLNSQHIQAQGKNGHTISHLIVEQGLGNYIEPLAKWIRQNSIPNNAGWTPLHQAVRNGDEWMTRTLVLAGSDISTKDNSGRTALHLACDVDDLGIVQFLLAHGANLSATDYNGHTLLDVTRIRTREFFLKLRQAGGVIDFRRMPRGLTPLFYAAWLGREDAARILLKAGADPSVQTESGETVLQRAVSAKHTNVVRLLLDVGVDVNVREFFHGYTAVMAAAASGADDSLRLLLKAGADVSAVNYDGRNGLHFAARMGHESTVRLLVNEGVDSSARDNWGDTPLRYAVKRHHKGVIRILQNPLSRLLHRMCAKYYLQTKAEVDRYWTTE